LRIARFRPFPTAIISRVVVAADEVRTVLRTSWQCIPGACTLLPGGAGSTSWRVTVGEDRYVAKQVPLGRRSAFEAGLAVAEYLDALGVPAGCPVRAADGALSVVVGGGALALLRWVPGRSLTTDDPVDQQWLGETLAVVHRMLRGFSHPGLAKHPRVRPDAAHLDVEPWLRPAVASAVQAVTRLCVTDQLTYGVLHGDPAPDAFRLDARTGRIALLQWGSVGTGPLVYDLAAAVISAGDAIVDGYLRRAPVTQSECSAALPVMLRLRYAVRADWHAARLARGAATAADHDGLRAARAALT
jgi:Ser/Thr protein kinase RdoA (MazF antagonist)